MVSAYLYYEYFSWLQFFLTYFRQLKIVLYRLEEADIYFV